ncbi:MAG: GspH/FimT family pseudopilin [Steroidobacteraceae bacterium]|jgi:type IV fimbrial biogenesis protein FimT|nr:GspH/FimT family pseudopilin [Steroidobacteraceae bacterium]
MKRQLGVTLLELMVAITVLALLLGIGVPSFTNVIRNNRLATQANELVTAFNVARSEASKRGLPVSVCVSSNGTACDTASPNWANGWIVFTDTATAGEVDGTDEVLQVTGRLAAGYGLEEAEVGASFIQFLPSGLAEPAAWRRLQLEWSAAPDGRRRCISVAPGGRIGTTREACT